MGSGTIPDSNIYASSIQSASTPARNGRLNYTSGSSWCAGTSDKNPYLQIDLQTLHIICAVSTQGNSQADQWVKTYTLLLSTDGITWTNYSELGGQAKVCYIGWLWIIWYLASIYVKLAIKGVIGMLRIICTIKIKQVFSSCSANIMNFRVIFLHSANDIVDAWSFICRKSTR